MIAAPTSAVSPTMVVLAIKLFLRPIPTCTFLLPAEARAVVQPTTVTGLRQVSHRAVNELDEVHQRVMRLQDDATSNYNRAR